MKHSSISPGFYENQDLVSFLSTNNICRFHGDIQYMLDIDIPTKMTLREHMNVTTSPPHTPTPNQYT